MENLILCLITGHYHMSYGWEAGPHGDFNPVCQVTGHCDVLFYGWEVGVIGEIDHEYTCNYRYMYVFVDVFKVREYIFIQRTRMVV